ncbi:ML domain-containing protein [Jimgerdemannia flammicorona]|uniref:Phosphatidylglycerol/phosphatidylinositol transfer protein n=1 Tax=Jimgerdemannia flammicorona TaxID=994334 RepID=A0A433DE92_9FUNG|nr:ML domain-containing protein [Jimgerdemannia flammicorona]
MNRTLLLSLLAVLSLAVLVRAASFPGGLFGLDPGSSDSATINTCGDEKDILIVKHINIDPDPPLKGKPLTIDAAGFLKERVVQGSMVDVIVKYSAIKLLQKSFDLCEQAKQVNKTCPIEEGEFTLVHTVDLPKDIPPGKYTVLAKARTGVEGDDRQITCITGVVIFRP